MAKPNYSKMTDDELVALNQDLGRQSDDIREQRVAISGELRKRSEAKEAKRAALQAQLDELNGVSPGDARGDGQVLDAAASSEDGKAGA